MLLNLSLPDSQGLDTFDQITQSSRETSVVILSGLDNVELAHLDNEAGARFDPDIVRAFLELLAGG